MYTQTQLMWPQQLKPLLVTFFAFLALSSYAQKGGKVMVDDIDGIKPKDTIFQVIGDQLTLEITAKHFDEGKIQVSERMFDDSNGQLYLSQNVSLKVGTTNTLTIDISALPASKHYWLSYSYGLPRAMKSKRKKFFKLR